MSFKQEVLNLNNFRVDGRKLLDIRFLDYSIHDNNLYYNQGLTKLKLNLSNVTSTTQQLNININTLNNNLSRNVLDNLISNLKSTFTSVIKYKYALNINIDLINLDGNLLSTLINSTSVLLLLNGIELTDITVSSSVGLFNQNYLIDLNNFEELNCNFITIASLPNLNQISLINLDSKFHHQNFQHILDLALESNKLLRTQILLIINKELRYLNKKLII